jgi:hypothetical protein
MFGWLLLGLLMTGGSFFCTTLPELKAQVAGWVGVVFFGFGTVAAILPRLANPSPQFTVDEQGIQCHRWHQGTIPWSDIEQVTIGTVHSTRFLCVRLKDPRMYLSNLTGVKSALAKANKELGFGDLTFSFQGLKPGLNEVWNYILANHISKTPFATPKG